jgi:peptidoglycan/LPS O-acetylase OafA/YrhL
VINNKTRVDIQIIRGVSIVAVVLFHLNSELFPAGYLGVDLFFIVSGYLITPKLYSAIKNSRGITSNSLLIFSFYKNRLFRLAPALGVSVLFTLSCFILLGIPSDLIRTVKQALFTLMLLGNYGSYSTSGSYFNPEVTPLQHMWSLSIESQYYLLIPIVLYLMQQLTSRFKIKMIANLVLALIFFASLFLFVFPRVQLELLHLLIPNLTENFIYYSPLSRVWQFLLGGAMGLNIPNLKNLNSFLKRKIHLNKKIIYIILAMVVMYAIFFAPYVYQAILVCCSCSIILRIGFNHTNIIYKLLSWIGNRSYSVYLYHFPLQYFLYNSQAVSQLIPSNLFKGATYIVLLIFASNMSYTYIEQVYFVKIRSIGNLIKIYQFFIIVPLIISMTLFFYSKSISNIVYIKPSIPPYGGREDNFGLGFMDKWCLGNNSEEYACYYNRDANLKTVVLLGDSRAEQYFKTIAGVATEIDWQLIAITHRGCRFSIIYKPEELPNRDCVNLNLMSLQKLKEINPDAIIISQALYFDENTLGMLESIIQINKLYPKLIVIGNNPTFPDSKDFMQLRPKIVGKYHAPKSYLISNVDETYFSVSKKFLERLFALNIKFIDPKNYFCKSLTCKRWENGNWLYFDAGHLSVYGANLASKDLKEFLLKQ